METKIMFVFSKKLLAPMSTRVPLEVQEIIDTLAESQGSDRAKWLRDAIDMKIELETGQSSSEHIEKSKNTKYSSVFRKVFTFFQALKKPDVAGRASSIHHLSGK
ncbi:hypothetical protein B9T36_09740 [Acinetobacter sp. ANC 4204]|uniref:hypothetical protein n=1 Tax=Acinetobacter sp. ANC 4204 TaxID=1977884 RepID=UPI000A34EC6D|nr:hypothetical protein [Acinetobacter sp. ANC 4204]OTG58628.1 hypothetical protein B9T36_09740 [Acinetobacter sp. ANC 4204]